jgi:hypothetical protein
LPEATSCAGVVSLKHAQEYYQQENNMITIEQTGNLVNVAVMGEFTLADFKQFEDSAVSKIQSHVPVSLLFDLRAMINYTVDVAWEEIKFFNREHQHDFNKIAVVTEDQWLTWQAWLSRLFMDADIRVFSNYKEAQSWAAV